MNNKEKRFLQYIAGTFVVPMFSAIGVLMFNSNAQAHYVESDINHAHVCTSSSSLNIRTEPNINSKKVGEIKQGKVVQIKAAYSDWETSETWYKIKATSNTNNISGYIASQYVCF